MTVVHVVLLSFKADASADAIAACLRELRGLAAMPGVLQLSCGQNFTSRGREFTHALTVHLADKAALDAYAVHPGSSRLCARAPQCRRNAAQAAACAHSTPSIPILPTATTVCSAPPRRQ
jgi:hypothetical protein